MSRREELINLLENKKIITAAKAQELKGLLLKDSKFNLDLFLTTAKITDIEKITELKAEMYHLPYKNLTEVAIKDDALRFIAEDIAKTYKAVCFFKDLTNAQIGLEKYDLKSIEAINFLALGKKIKPEYFLISEPSFKAVFKQYEKAEEEISTAIKVKTKAEGEEFLQIEELGDILTEEDVNSAPVAKIVSVIIKHALESRASDIHIEPYEKESRVRYRIDGILHNSLTLPKKIHMAVVARIKVLAKLKLDENRIPQDGHIRLVVDNREIDFRVSVLPVSTGEKIEMRILDQAKGMIALEDLGFNSFCYDLIKETIKRTSGIILLTGPTGSGKTTTLYAVLNILNREAVNISTLEDPIEYQMKGINQSQVKPDLGFSFATGLRSLLRQDPNIIMVGEVRDEETAELAIQAGLTGHLVLSTLHTNDALGTIFRLLDMDIEPFLLASTLRTAIAQRLVRRLCTYCKKEFPMPEKMLEQIMAALKDVPADILKKELPDLDSLDKIKSAKFYQPVGCARCSSTGYTDRIAIAEAITVNDELRDVMINHRQGLTIETIKASQPFISIKQDGLFKVLKGVTNIDEVLRVVEIENL